MHALMIDVDEMIRNGYDDETIDQGRKSNDLIDSFLKSPLGVHLNKMDDLDEFGASGGYLHSSESIKDEIQSGSAPCGFLFLFGYLPIWCSIGGNQIVYSLDDGSFYWADHISFNADRITIPVSYEDLPFSEENIKRALIQISDDKPDQFIMDLIENKYEEKLDELD